LDRVLGLDDLVGSDDVFFAATGITSGEFLKGVQYSGERAETHSITMRARSGTLRRIETSHHIGLKRDLPSGAAYVPD
jgi:fructose-1,6-bisphosphatase II